MIAYRLGQLPSDLDRPSEKEKLPQGPRLSLGEAACVTLPDGTHLREASADQMHAWFAQLAAQAGASKNILGQVLSGLDLELWEDRWYALNEILELSASVRDVFEGKVREPGVIQSEQGGMTRAELEELLEEYGLRVALSRKGNGLGSVYAQRNVPCRVKIYLGSLAALEEGCLTEELVRSKLEAKLRLQPEEKEAA